MRMGNGAYLLWGGGLVHRPSKNVSVVHAMMIPSSSKEPESYILPHFFFPAALPVVSVS